MSTATDTGADTLLSTGWAPRPAVNLLPPEVADARHFRRVQLALGGGLALTVGVVGLLYVAALGSVTDATTEVGAASATTGQLRAEAAQYADVTALYARAAAAEAMLTEAMGQEVRWSGMLSDLSLTTPENVWLKSLTFAQAPAEAALGSTEPGIGTVVVSGVGFSHDDVAVWLESLSGQKGYTNAYFSSATESRIGSRTVVDFTSTATVTADALSGSYTKPAGG